jgi:hypothetical protein
LFFLELQARELLVVGDKVDLDDPSARHGEADDGDWPAGRSDYGLNGDASGLHNIWRLNDPTAMAGLSLAVLTAFAVLLTFAAIRVFTRSAVS